ncbi:MAG TPA: cytochrome c3 family protein [Blastocatellia bacterium]|nr:cytochrome c3 family protein [Blastocatellia bacterium]
MITTERKTRLLAIGAFVAMGAWLALTSPGVGEANPTFEQTRERTVRSGFPHDQKDHQKVECAACHQGGPQKPINTDEPMAKDFPHTSCIRCHNFAAEIFKATSGKNRFCGVCHEQRSISRTDKALRPGLLSAGNTGEFEDVFSHKAHRKSLPAAFQIRPVSLPRPYGAQFSGGASPRCTDCHTQVQRAQPQAKEMRTEKGHAACFVCHGSQPEARNATAAEFPYSSDCRVCHALRGSGTIARSRFGLVTEFKHDDHTLDIRPKRKTDFPISAALDRLCIECHKPADEAARLSEIALPELAYCQKCHIDNRPGLPGRLSEEVSAKLLKK